MLTALDRHIIEAALRPPARRSDAYRIAAAALGRRAPVRKYAQTTTPIVGTDNPQQIAYCVAIEPDQGDYDGEAMDAAQIERTAHRFMTHSRIVKSMHRTPIDAVPVESYIAPQDLQFCCPTRGAQKVPKGAWVLGIKVNDPAQWQRVQSGEYTGISVGGFGLRVPA